MLSPVLSPASSAPLVSLRLSLPSQRGGGVAVVGPAACMPAPRLRSLSLLLASRASHSLTMSLIFLWCSAAWGGWWDMVGVGMW